MDLTNPKIIIEQLQQGKLRAKKYLGQHFLTSSKILEIIIKATNLSKNDVVLEIGPGLGVLTVELASRVKKVIAVEKDDNLIGLLQNNLEAENLINKVEIINQDILKLEVNSLPNKYKLVANLPYQVTSPVLWKFLHEVDNKPESLTIMIQKEVAERLLARPGDMSLLGILVQYYGEVRLITKVKSTQFFPPPKVESAVVQINLKTAKQNIDKENFFILVKAGFASKRKKLKNNLVILGFTGQQIIDALDKVKLKTNSRAQELSADDWLKLYQMLYTN